MILNNFKTEGLSQSEQSKLSLLRVFLEMHVPLQMVELQKRGVQPHSPEFRRELDALSEAIASQGDAILYKSKNTSEAVSKLSKAIAMMLFSNQSEIISFIGLKFSYNSNSLMLVEIREETQ